MTQLNRVYPSPAMEIFENLMLGFFTETRHKITVPSLKTILCHQLKSISKRNLIAFSW